MFVHRLTFTAELLSRLVSGLQKYFALLESLICKRLVFLKSIGVKFGSLKAEEFLTTRQATYICYDRVGARKPFCSFSNDLQSLAHPSQLQVQK